MKFSTSTLVAALLAAIQPAQALDAAGWRAQSIYQVMVDRFAREDGSTTASCDLSSYCGGNWQGLINQLDYIQGMGFTAIWISPVIKQIYGMTDDGDSYHGYWPQDITTLNVNFGDEASLASLSEAVHNRGMYIMVDVVPNHMASATTRDDVDFSLFVPFDSAGYYHVPCSIDYTDPESVLDCWEGDDIVALADLHTEDTYVQTTYNAWAQNLIETYNIDGFRADSMQQVYSSFWTSFSAASDIYIVGEVFNGDPTYTCPYQDYLPGLMNYPAYYWITSAFESTSSTMTELHTGITTLQTDCSDVTLLGTFLENHDNPRFPSITSDITLAANAIGFTMLSDGIPIIYQGQEQHLSGDGVPNNREAIWLQGYDTSAELYEYISKYNAIRSYAISKDATYPSTLVTSRVSGDSQAIAVLKGSDGYQTIAILSSYGSDASSHTFNLAASFHQYSANDVIVDVLSCTTYTIDADGNLFLTITEGAPMVLYKLSNLADSEICPDVTMTTYCLPDTVAVTFEMYVSVDDDVNLVLTGDVDALGDSSVSAGITLSDDDYTPCDPLFQTTVDLAPGTVVQYRYYQVSTLGYTGDGSSHTYTVPSDCDVTSDTIVNTWTSLR